MWIVSNSADTSRETTPSQARKGRCRDLTARTYSRKAMVKAKSKAQ
jgi:hypothetical protein